MDMETLKLIWLNLSFYILFLVFSLVYIPSMIMGVAVARPFSSHAATMRRFRTVIAWYGRTIVSVLPFPLVRVRFEDMRGDSGPGPWLFAGNHRSLSDPFLMGMLPVDGVELMKRWPLKIPVIGFLARLAKYPCPELMTPEEFVSEAVQIVAQGISIISFPEGTRTRTGEMGPFHSGIFRVALETRVPIVPFCVHGNAKIPRPGSLLLRPGVLGLRLMPVLKWEEYKDLTAFQLKNKVRDLVRAELEVLEGKG